VSETTRSQPTMSAADVQRVARKISIQASKLADEAAPVTRQFATTARESAGSAAEWASPHVNRARGWMAIQAARGSASMQETVAPKVAEMLDGAARKLEPPKPRSRRWPKILTGVLLLASGAAAAAAMAMRSRERPFPIPMPSRPPASATGDQSSTVLNPSAEQEMTPTESEVNGLSRTR
jgi:hypothetical protein